MNHKPPDPKVVARIHHLSKVDGLSQAAIATRCGIGTSTVKRMLEKKPEKKNGSTWRDGAARPARRACS
jgi:DNA-binding transcriptional regulator LsrR (DeoR family)